MAKRYNIPSRFLAATALVFVYMVSVVGTSGLFLAASTSSADARGRGGGYRGGGRGYGLGHVWSRQGLRTRLRLRRRLRCAGRARWRLLLQPPLGSRRLPVLIAA